MRWINYCPKEDFGLFSCEDLSHTPSSKIQSGSQALQRLLVVRSQMDTDQLRPQPNQQNEWKREKARRERIFEDKKTWYFFLIWKLRKGSAFYRCRRLWKLHVWERHVKLLSVRGEFAKRSHKTLPHDLLAEHLNGVNKHANVESTQKEFWNFEESTTHTYGVDLDKVDWIWPHI